VLLSNGMFMRVTVHVFPTSMRLWGFFFSERVHCSKELENWHLYAAIFSVGILMATAWRHVRCGFDLREFAIRAKAMDDLFRCISFLNALTLLVVTTVLLCFEAYSWVRQCDPGVYLSLIIKAVILLLLFSMANQWFGMISVVLKWLTCVMKKGFSHRTGDPALITISTNHIRPLETVIWPSSIVSDIMLNAPHRVVTAIVVPPSSETRTFVRVPCIASASR